MLPVAAGLIAFGACSNVDLTPILMSGNQAPGLPVGYMVADVQTITIGKDIKQTAITGRITGPGVTSQNDRCLWTLGPSGYSLIARTGTIAPQTSNQFNSLTFAKVTPQGATYFEGGLAGAGASGTGVWTTSAAGTVVVMRDGAVAPQTGGAVFNEQFVYGSVRASNERFAFKAGLSGSGVSSNNNQGIWAGPVAALALVARKGAAAPWTGAGTFTGLDTPWSIAANGSILFTGAAVSQGATVSRAGLWATVNGATSLVGKEDEPAPGTAALFSRFWGGALRENGRLAFSGRTSDGREGIWSGTLQAMSSAVRSEDIAVGAGPGRVFSDFEPPIPLSNGDFVFRGNFGLASPGFDEWGIWRHTGAGLALLGGEGLAAPGAEPGVVFESVDRAMVNDHGQVVFGGILAGPGIGENNNFGLWYSDWNDANLVKLLIREGDLLEVSSGLWKVVTGLNYLPGVSGYHGRCDSLSEDGTLAFAATFADGSSGVFTTAIPAPSTFSVLGLISAGLCRRRNAK